jgi:hypothetical protein
MKFTGANIKDGKMRGEWAELRFMARASEQGLGVSKPWGDSRAYDFIIEHKGKLLRVQVKSTTHPRYHSYVCCFHGHKNRRYTAEQIAFVAAYIVPKDIWFIFPIAVIMKVHSSAVLSPHMKVSKYGPYQEAWHLLRGEGDSTFGRKIPG